MSAEPIVVLGAGPAGMSAAWRLSERGCKVVVLERDTAVGGMGKTITVGEYAVDYGPHTFHIRETEESRAIHAAIKPFFGDDPLILTRGTRVLLRGKEYVYPLEMLQVLTGVSPLLSARIIFDYLMATMKSTLAPPKQEDSFEEWGVRNLGRTLYDLCFGIYSARVWGLPTSQISSKQAQRVAKLNLKNIILRTLGIKADPATYFTKYMYPRAGISVLFENMAAASRAEAAAACSSSRRRSDWSAKAIGSRASSTARTAARRRSRAAACCRRCRCRSWCGMMTPALPPTVAEHASKLRYRSLKLIYIALKRPQLTDYHWVYLLDEQFRVNRMSEQKNVSPDMVPPDRTVLCIELSLLERRAVVDRGDEEISELRSPTCMKMGYGVTEAEVEDYHVTDIATAYPVYELNFEDHLIPVLEGVHAVPQPADARPPRPVSQQQHGRQRAARDEGRRPDRRRRDSTAAPGCQRCWRS